MTLSDDTGSEQEYEVIFKAVCDSALNFGQDDEDQDQMNLEIPDPPRPLFASMDKNGEIRVLWDSRMKTD